MIWGFPYMGVPLKSSILFSDFPLQTIQLLGVPHDYGTPYFIGYLPWPIKMATPIVVASIRAGANKAPIRPQVPETDRADTRDLGGEGLWLHSRMENGSS